MIRECGGGGLIRKAMHKEFCVRQTDRKRIHARHRHTLDDLKDI